MRKISEVGVEYNVPEKTYPEKRNREDKPVRYGQKIGLVSFGYGRETG
jgi:hypothetical protein